jgi:hypothetical protein
MSVHIWKKAPAEKTGAFCFTAAIRERARALGEVKTSWNTMYFRSRDHALVSAAEPLKTFQKIEPFQCRRTFAA